MERSQLTRRFRFDEAWDSPANRKLHDMRPPSYFCPSRPRGCREGVYELCRSRRPEDPLPRWRKTRRLADIRDDPRNTLMLVESVNTSIHWMEPRDLKWDQMSFSVNDRSRPSISSEHRVASHPGPHVVTADDGVAFLEASMPSAFIKALLVIDDGETATLRQGPRRD